MNAQDTSAVSETLSDLKVRLASLRQDSEHFRSLEHRAHTEFIRHREELDTLATRERALYSASEDELRRQLQSTLGEQQRLLDRLRADRMAQERALCQRLAESRSGAVESAAALEAELHSLRAEWAAMHTAIREASAWRLGAEDELRRALQNQERWQQALEDAKQITRAGEIAAPPPLSSTVAAGAAASVGAPATSAAGLAHPSGHQRCCACEVCRRLFLPSSTQAEGRGACSHHVQALLSHAERQARMVPSPVRRRGPSPRRSLPPQRPPPAAAAAATEAGLVSSPPRQRDSSGYHANLSVRAMYRAADSLSRELDAMQREYSYCQQQLRDPHGDTVAASQRMRALLPNMERKARQVEVLRTRAAKAAFVRPYDVLAEEAEAAAKAHRRDSREIYDDLMNVVRLSSSYSR